MQLAWTIDFKIEDLRGEAHIKKPDNPIAIDPPRFSLSYKLPDDAFQAADFVAGLSSQYHEFESYDDEEADWSKCGPDLGNITITKETDLASLELYKTCLEYDPGLNPRLLEVELEGSAVIPTAEELSWIKSGGRWVSRNKARSQPFFTIKLEDCRILSISFNDMKETLTLNFKTISWSYTRFDLSGQLTPDHASWTQDE